jgi:hypothetical protein
VLVGNGRVAAVLGVDADAFPGASEPDLAITARIRAGGRVLCSRSSALADNGPNRVLLVSCPTAPVGQVTVEAAVGTAVLRVGGTLKP